MPCEEDVVCEPSITSSSHLYSSPAPRSQPHISSHPLSHTPLPASLCHTRDGCSSDGSEEEWQPRTDPAATNLSSHTRGARGDGAALLSSMASAQSLKAQQKVGGIGGQGAGQVGERSALSCRRADAREDGGWETGERGEGERGREVHLPHLKGL